VKKIRVVTATRESMENFRTRTATGQSLSFCPPDSATEARIYPNNQRGLASIYNEEIENAKDDPAILVFIHDDVWLLDHFWPERVRSALDHFDVVGLVGSKRRLPNQPSWFFHDTSFTVDRTHLSGVIAEGKSLPQDNVSYFGPSGVEVMLLDGVMLWADSEDLHETGLRFDEQFRFHHYDMDFCRSAEKMGLRMGTWPLSVMHQSGGSFNSPSWRLSYEKYLLKWGE
jgi:GT2 family glycosyltransferase